MEALMVAAFMFFVIVSWLKGLGAPRSASEQRMADEEEYDAIAYMQQHADRERFGDWH